MVNLTGLVVYLVIEHWILAPRPEGYELNGIDVINLWITRLLPVLVVAALVNGTWLFQLLHRNPPNRATLLRAWAATGLAWCLAFIYRGLTIRIAEFAIMIVMDKARR